MVSHYCVACVRMYVNAAMSGGRVGETFTARIPSEGIAIICACRGVAGGGVPLFLLSTDAVIARETARAEPYFHGTLAEHLESDVACWPRPAACK